MASSFNPGDSLLCTEASDDEEGSDRTVETSEDEEEERCLMVRSPTSKRARSWLVEDDESSDEDVDEADHDPKTPFDQDKPVVLTPNELKIISSKATTLRCSNSVGDHVHYPFHGRHKHARDVTQLSVVNVVQSVGMDGKNETQWLGAYTVVGLIRSRQELVLERVARAVRGCDTPHLIDAVGNRILHDPVMSGPLLERRMASYHKVMSFLARPQPRPAPVVRPTISTRPQVGESIKKTKIDKCVRDFGAMFWNK